MAERELRFARQRRSWPGDDQPPALQRASASVRSGRGSIDSSVVGQNTRPTTAASWSACFSRFGRASTRAASSARTVLGMVNPSPFAADTCLASSSANSGFPSAVATTRSVSSERSLGSSAPTSARDCFSVSGSKPICEVPGPVVHPTCSSPNSGRALTTSSTGPADRASISCTICSRGSSAQCASSITTSTGPPAARPVRNAGHASATSSATEPGETRRSGLSGSVIPDAMASAAITRSASAGSTTPATRSRSFDTAVTAGSPSAIPVAAQRTSRNAQYVIPSPYDRQRPRYTAGADDIAMRETNSSIRRVFPTPA